MSSQNQEEIMDQVKHQMAAAMVQDMISKMTEKCFNKCVVKPGKSLDNSEQKCISMCMDRFMDSWKLVSRAYSNRLQSEQDKM